MRIGRRRAVRCHGARPRAIPGVGQRGMSNTEGCTPRPASFSRPVPSEGNSRADRRPGARQREVMIKKVYACCWLTGVYDPKETPCQSRNSMRGGYD